MNSIETDNQLTPEEAELQSEFKTLLDQFSDVLLDKLIANERKYHFGTSWKIPDWEQQLQRDIVTHLQKGDPRDIAIYSLFAWYHKWSTASATTRELNTLTEDEAKTVFALAFGYGPTPEMFHYTHHEPMSEYHTWSIVISDSIQTLEIHSHGFVYGYRWRRETTGFNVYKVLHYLDSIGVKFLNI